jgi:hypothetical protein
MEQQLLVDRDSDDSEFMQQWASHGRHISSTTTVSATDDALTSLKASEVISSWQPVLEALARVACCLFCTRFLLVLTQCTEASGMAQLNDALQAGLESHCTLVSSAGEHEKDNGGDSEFGCSAPSQHANETFTGRAALCVDNPLASFDSCALGSARSSTGAQEASLQQSVAAQLQIAVHMACHQV